MGSLTEARPSGEDREKSVARYTRTVGLGL